MLSLKIFFYKLIRCGAFLFLVLVPVVNMSISSLLLGFYGDNHPLIVMTLHLFAGIEETILFLVDVVKIFIVDLVEEA